MLFGSALRCLRDVGAQFLRKRSVMRRTRAELLAVDGDFTVDPRRAHTCICIRWSKSRAARLAIACSVAKQRLERPSQPPLERCRRNEQAAAADLCVSPRAWRV